MFQPRAKLEFVRRYCPPSLGWKVCVDIDPSEEGRTGGTRLSQESRNRQKAMEIDAAVVKKEFDSLAVTIGARSGWCRQHQLPYYQGDPDIIGFNSKNGRCLIAEVEALSSGQPEQKLYKAVGQAVLWASQASADRWNREIIIVVFGDEMARHLNKMTVLDKLSITGFQIAQLPAQDRVLFGSSSTCEIARK